MEKKYKALALDLDGTLMDSNKKLSDVNKKAVWEAIDVGTAVILASGRPMFGVLPVARMLELEKRGGYVLAYNGGNILDCKTGKLVYERYVPKQCIEDICIAARECDVAPLTYYKDKVISERADDEYVIKEAFCNSASIMQVDNIPEFVDYPVSKVLVVGEHKKLIPVKEKLENKYSDILELFFSLSSTIEFLLLTLVSSTLLLINPKFEPESFFVNTSVIVLLFPGFIVCAANALDLSTPSLSYQESFKLDLNSIPSGK